MTSNLMKKYYAGQQHPYKIFQVQVEEIMRKGWDGVVVDAGCGRSAPVLRSLTVRPRVPVGIDMVAFENGVGRNLHLINGDLSRLPLAGRTVDCIFTRSVFEHLAKPDKVYQEMYRVLKSGGRLVVLTANMWDYATLIARFLPASWHAGIVKFVEGRDEEDTFPTVYRSNTHSSIKRLAEETGFQINI